MEENTGNNSTTSTKPNADNVDIHDENMDEEPEGCDGETDPPRDKEMEHKDIKNSTTSTNDFIEPSLCMALDTVPQPEGLRETMDAYNKLWGAIIDKAKGLMAWREAKQCPDPSGNGSELYARALIERGHSDRANTTNNGFQEAIEILQELLLMTPGRIYERTMLLVRAYAGKGDFKTAEEKFYSFKKQAEIRTVYGDVGMYQFHDKQNNVRWEMMRTEADVHMIQGKDNPFFLWVEKKLATTDPRSVDDLRTFDNIAKYYAIKKDWESAKKYGWAVVSRLDVNVGHDPESAAVANHNYAEYFRRLGDNQMARKYHEQNVGLLTKELGPEHQYTLRAKEGLAETYADLGRRTESIKYLYEVVCATIAPEDISAVVRNEAELWKWFGTAHKNRVIGYPVS